MKHTRMNSQRDPFYRLPVKVHPCYKCYKKYTETGFVSGSKLNQKNSCATKSLNQSPESLTPKMKAFVLQKRKLNHIMIQIQLFQSQNLMSIFRSTAQHKHVKPRSETQ